MFVCLFVCLFFALTPRYQCQNNQPVDLGHSMDEDEDEGIEENLQKNNSKKAYQFVKELTSSKQGRTNTIQDKAGKCLTEEQDILKRGTEYCCELYTHTQQQEIPRC